MSDAEAIAVALWVLLTFLDAHVDVLPILAVTSPQKRCGKTTLLTILSQLTRRPLPASSISSAALYRCIEKFTPCLLIDEADTFLKDNVELKGLLNSGHTRQMAKVIKINVDTMEPEKYSTWAPKAIACIGKLSETLTDRAIEIRLQRRSHTEPVGKLRDANPETFARLQSMAHRWAVDNGDRVKQARPAIPQVLNDRAGDNWHPLLAIASVAEFNGVDNVVLALNADQSEESVPLLLLASVRHVFAQEGADSIPTETILEKLNQDKESPWADWKNGMTSEKLGRILKSFGVKSEQRQKESERHRGYSLKALQSVFDRYLTPVPPPPHENGPQPVHLSADQVAEPIGSAQVQGTQPVHAQVPNFDPCSADPLPEPIGKEMHKFQPKLQMGGMNGSVHSNGHDEDSDEETVLSPENGYGTRPRLPKQGQG
jgi:putative DNA primase/helicase